MSHASGRLTVLHLSDVHATGDGLLYGAVDGAGRLRAVAEHVRTAGITPEAVVITGDLAQRGHPAAYAALRDELAALEAAVGAPVLTVIGNHDDPDAARLLPGHAHGHHRSVIVAGLRFILLDSAAGELGRSQLDWLASELEAPHDGDTIIALHHPPLGSPLPTLAKAGLQDADALLDVLAPAGVRIVLSGHFHHALAAEVRGVTISVGPALAYHQVMDGDRERVRGHDRGMFSVVHLRPDVVTTTSVSLEKPAPLFSSAVPRFAQTAPPRTPPAPSRTETASNR